MIEIIILKSLITLIPFDAEVNTSGQLPIALVYFRAYVIISALSLADTVSTKRSYLVPTSIGNASALRYLMFLNHFFTDESDYLEVRSNKKIHACAPSHEIGIIY